MNNVVKIVENFQSINGKVLTAGILDLTINDLENYLNGKIDFSHREDEFIQQIKDSFKIDYFSNLKSTLLKHIERINKPGLYNFILPPDSGINEVLAMVFSQLGIEVSFSNSLDNDSIHTKKILDLTSRNTINNEEKLVTFSRTKPVIILTTLDSYHLATERVIIPGLSENEMLTLLKTTFKNYNLDSKLLSNLCAMAGYSFKKLSFYIEVLKDLIIRNEPIDDTILKKLKKMERDNECKVKS